MRVFSITQILHLIISDREAFRIFLSCFCGQIFRDHRIIAGSVAEDLCGQEFPGNRASLAVFPQFLQYGIIIVRITDDRNGLIVLCGASQHARAADIDVLDDFLMRDARLLHGLLERIQIYTDQVDQLDAQLLELCHMALVVAYAQ